MEVLKSPKVRVSLQKLLTQIVQTGEDVGIELNGELVALLTKNEPTQSVPPIYITGEEAREGWSELLEAVMVRNARFFFRNRKTKDVMYLVRAPKYRNKFERRWVNHIADWKAEQDRTAQPDINDVIEGQEELQTLLASLAEEVTGTSKKLNQVFALLYRQGDIFKYPELGTTPLKSASDI